MLVNFSDTMWISCYDPRGHNYLSLWGRSLKIRTPNHRWQRKKDEGQNVIPIKLTETKVEDGDSMVAQCKESTCQGRRFSFDPCVGKFLWRREWQPTSVFLPRKSHGQRSLLGSSPWSCKESDTTGQLTHPYTYTHRKIQPNWHKKKQKILVL